MTKAQLLFKSVQYRKTLLRSIKKAEAGHTGGSLSCIDILNVLYNQVLRVSPDRFEDPNRDRYIQSKGHSVEALYTVLQDRGFFPAEELDTLSRYRSHFVGHPTRKVPGVEHNTGALGHGLSVAVGIALAGKLDQRDYRVFTLLGDGELTEGSNWEAFLSAAHYELDNLVAILDRNALQITDKTEQVCRLEPLQEKLEAFGWAVTSIDGNSIEELMEVFEHIPLERSKPSFVLARTVKGKGVSFIEDQLSWHHHVPNDEEYQQAMEELAQAEAKLKGVR